jgi:hypothetical protein
VLSTFIFTGKFSSFTGPVIVLPIYLLEFIIIFGLKIDEIKDNELVIKYGESFS